MGLVMLTISYRYSPDTGNMPSIIIIKSTVVTRRFTHTACIEFLDNKGDFYITKDSYLCLLSDEELIAEYEKGNMGDSIECIGHCDSEELQKIYKQVCAVRDKEYSIVSPELVPCMITNTVYWNSYYYNKKGQLKNIFLHLYEYAAGHYSKYTDVNDIFFWYEGKEADFLKNYYK